MTTIHIQTSLPDDDAQRLRDLEKTIHALNLERSSILQRQNARQSAINQLPSEILVDIFLAAVNHDLSHDMPTEDGEKTEGILPLFLGSICRKWRDISWTTPRLWRRIPLILSRKNYSSQVSVLQEWLFRTNDSQCSLSIVITLGTDDISTWVEDPPQEIISAIVPHSHRWRHFDFFLFSTCYSQLLNISHHLPKLESLAMSSSVPFLPAFVWTLFTEVPMLRRLRLSRMALSHIPLPVTQLSHATLCDMSVTDCLDILRQCHNLEHCSFVNLLGPHEIDFPTEPIISHKLKSLRVEFSSQLVVAAFLPFLRCISIPAARDITITEIGMPSYMDEAFFVSDAIVAFACSERCPIKLLQSMSIQVFDFEDEKLLRLLAGATQLEQMKIVKTSGVGRYDISGFNAFNTKIVSALTLLEHDQSFRYVPKLNSLYYSGPVQFTVEELLSFLEARQKHGFLKEFVIPKSAFWGTSAKTFALCTRFEELVEGGMSLCVVLGGEKWI